MVDPVILQTLKLDIVVILHKRNLNQKKRDKKQKISIEKEILILYV